MNVYTVKILLLWFLVASSWAFSNDEELNKKQLCSASFQAPPGVEVISSGRDNDVLPIYEKLLRDFYKEGGVADRLGYARPPHQAVFTPSSQLAMLATLGRHAVRHWIDGSQLVRAFESAGVMEFVTPGCPTCRSFYSDTTEPNEQLSIIMHVFGHNHYSANALPSRVRNFDPIYESVLLGEVMNDARQTADWAEVDHWYQLLNTFEMLQDISSGSFDPPEKFSPEKAYVNGKRVDVVRQPTPDILQAFVANLPATAPKWKVDMARHFERMSRMRGYVPNSKILNEGWAVMSQFLLPKHLKLDSSAQMVDYAGLMQGVVGRGIQLSNPYWLGREAWLNFRERFKNFPENKGLSIEELDARFVAEATRIIKVYGDFDGLRKLLDGHFVEKYKLYMKEQITDWNELDYNLPGRTEENNAQFKIVSRDPREIIDYIVDQFANFRKRFPQVDLVSLDVGGTTGALLRLNAEEGRSLNIRSSVLTCFVMAQAWERNIVLEAPFALPTQGRRGEPVLKVYNLRLEVTPSGRVEFVHLKNLPEGKARSEDEGQVVAELSAVAKELIDDFQAENLGFHGDEYEEDLTRRMGAFVEKIIESNTQAASRVISHAPESAGAIRAYTEALKYRLPQRLARLASGKIKARSGKGGVFLKVFPEIPHFSFDSRAHGIKPTQDSKLLASLKFDDEVVSIGALSESDSAAQGSFAPEDLVVYASKAMARKLGSGDGAVGDKHWGKGDGDGQSGGEDGDDPDTGSGPAQARPEEVFITFDQLSEILKLELPNRKKRKAHMIDSKTKIFDGGKSFPEGEVLWTRMMPTIMVTGKAMLEKKWKDEHPDLDPSEVPEFSRREYFQEGLRYLKEEDYIVRDRITVKQPDTQAVFVRVLDMSGSMHGIPQQTAKRFFDNMMQLIKRKYKKIEVINIGFNHETAIVMNDEQFYGSFLNGADHYNLGWLKAKEILSQPRLQNFDKYLVTVGDYQTPHDSEFEPIMKSLWEMLNWGANVQTTHSGDYATASIKSFFKRYKNENEWFDFGTIDQSLESHIELVKKFFGPKSEKP